HGDSARLAIAPDGIELTGTLFTSRAPARNQMKIRRFLVDDQALRNNGSASPCGTVPCRRPGTQE
ncbi:hypothetical protein AVEN_511-1, partial [Araneus ventricosus]